MRVETRVNNAMQGGQSRTERTQWISHRRKSKSQDWTKYAISIAKYFCKSKW